MSNYTKATDFLSKDAMLPGNPLKVVRGSEIDAEFEAIQTAVATKVESTDIDTAVDAAKETIEQVVGYVAGTAPGKAVMLTAGITLATGLAAGTSFLLYNNSATTITITQGSGLTLRLGATTSTGNRYLPGRSLALVFVVSTTEYVLTGGGSY